MVQPEPEERGRISLFFRLYRARYQATLAALAAEGLQDVGQPHILFLLREGEDLPDQTELAGRLRVSPATVAASLKSLERMGYITRRSDPDDARKKRIALTDKGRDARARCMAVFEWVERQLYAGFSRQELRQMREYYLRMLENMYQIGAAAADGTGGPGRKGRDSM